MLYHHEQVKPLYRIRRGNSDDPALQSSRRKAIVEAGFRDIHDEAVRDGGALSKAKESSVAPELSDLVICEAVKFTGFKVSVLRSCFMFFK